MFYKKEKSIESFFKAIHLVTRKLHMVPLGFSYKILNISIHKKTRVKM